MARRKKVDLQPYLTDCEYGERRLRGYGLPYIPLPDDIHAKLWLRMQWLLDKPGCDLAEHQFWWECFPQEAVHQGAVEALFESYDEVALLSDNHPEQGFIVPGKELAQVRFTWDDLYLIPVRTRHLVAATDHEHYGPWLIELPKVPTNVQIRLIRPPLRQR